MAKNKKIIPELRFPEFEKEWELRPFSKYITLYRGSSPRPISEYLTQNELGVNWIKIGDTSCINDFIIRSVSEKITPEGAKKSRAVKKGELILANSMSYGSTYLLKVEGCIYDGWFVLREYEEFFDKQFLLQLLNSEYTQRQYKKYAAGGIVKNISSEIVYNILLPKTSKQQQKKIASCLSSLDEVIEAHSRKLELLKNHKKGLMQNLFPQEGEKVPKFRFPQFEKDKEWTSYTLKDLTKINQGLQISISERYTEKVENSFFYITNEFLKSNSERTYYIKNPPENVRCKKEDVLMTRTGNTGQVVTGVSGAFHNNFFKIQFDRKILNKDFLVYFLRLPDTQHIIMSFAGASTIPDLNHSDFYRITIKTPLPKEQKKIASCLSALDELIIAEADKIEQLQQHKKGLMQGLFPKIEN